MEVKAPKCPNCSAPISYGTLKCKYCGAYLVLQNNALSLKTLTACPECDAPIGVGSFICVNCGKILTTNSKELDMLKMLQERIQFNQNKLLNSVFNIVRERLEPKEYIYFVIGTRGVFWKGTDKQAVVTNKRIVRYQNGKFSDIHYGDIVSISKPIDQTPRDFILAGSYSVVITTHEEDIPFLFSDLPTAEGFSREANLAYNNSTLKKKDINALLCFTKI